MAEENQVEPQQVTTKEPQQITKEPQGKAAKAQRATKEPQRVTTKNPKKVEAGKRLAESNRFSNSNIYFLQTQIYNVNITN